jgi:hypothetical protein
MGEHLRGDSAGCSTQIDSAPVALRDMQIVFRRGPLLLCVLGWDEGSAATRLTADACLCGGGSGWLAQIGEDG